MAGLDEYWQSDSEIVGEILRAPWALPGHFIGRLLAARLAAFAGAIRQWLVAFRTRVSSRMSDRWLGLD